ncbi:putative histone H1 [Iris pallida]|uniref:Histone H1 n=1 Tax=Iris pallida TaxID=29817 RepID=A0AAX6GC00_IRIPA|nr:putative histone H1 [Iris pallida]
MVTADPVHAVDPAPAAAAAKKKASSPKKPRSTPSHPTYLEMIGEAIASLKERTGSSQYAITKFVEDKHRAHLPPNFKKLILVQLRKLTASGKLVKNKNSYKLHSAAAFAAAAAKPKKPAVAVAGKKRPAAAGKPSARAAKSAKAAAKDAPAKKAAKPAVKPKAAVAKVKRAAPSPAKAKKAARPKSVKKTPVKKSALAKKAKK